MLLFGRVLKAVSDIVPGAGAEQIKSRLNMFIREVNKSFPVYKYGEYLLPKGNFTATFDSITSPGVNTTLSSVGNELTDGDTITIYDSSTIDGEYPVSNVQDDSFDIVAVFAADESGSWYKHSIAAYLDFPDIVQDITDLYIDDEEVRLIDYKDYRAGGYASTLYAFVDHSSRKVYFAGNLASDNVVRFNGRVNVSEVSEIESTTEIDLAEKFFDITVKYIVQKLFLFGNLQDPELYPVFAREYYEARKLIKATGESIKSLKVW